MTLAGHLCVGNGAEKRLGSPSVVSRPSMINIHAISGTEIASKEVVAFFRPQVQPHRLLVAFAMRVDFTN